MFVASHLDLDKFAAHEHAAAEADYIFRFVISSTVFYSMQPFIVLPSFIS